MSKERLCLFVSLVKPRGVYKQKPGLSLSSFHFKILSHLTINIIMDMKILFGVLLVTLDTTQSKSIHTEPMCTRFSYDELLLEKMIKIEHKTGVMIDNFSEISKQVKTDLEHVKGEFDKIQSHAKALSTEGHDTIENIKSRFEEMIKEQAEKIAETVLRETEKYKKEISDLKGKQIYVSSESMRRF